MKIIAVFAFLALAYAKPEAPQVQSIVLPEAPKPLVASPYGETVRIAAPFEALVPASADAARTVEVEDPKSYKDIPAANPPFDRNVPIRRFNVAYKTPVVVNYVEENAAPQYQAPIDIGMVFVPEDVMRAVAAADAMNAVDIPLFPVHMPEIVPESENLAVKFVDSSIESVQVSGAAPSEFDVVRIAEAPEETVQVQPVVLPEPAMPVIESEDVSFNSPVESEQILRVAPSELETVRIVEAPRVEMQIPAILFVESANNFAVKFVDSPMEAEQVMMGAPSELEAVRVVDAPVEEVEQPKQFVNIAEMPALLQNVNRPYPVYNNPLLR